METLVLSNCNHVTILQFQFIAINCLNLVDLSDKAAKKQAERNKGGNGRPQNTEKKPEEGEKVGIV